jgi:hypothetical protein
MTTLTISNIDESGMEESDMEESDMEESDMEESGMEESGMNEEVIFIFQARIFGFLHGFLPSLFYYSQETKK